MRPHRAWAFGAAVGGLAAPLLILAFLGFSAGCGSRTGLLVPFAGGADDSGAALGPDVVASGEGGDAHAGLDALPPLDAQPLRDANVDLCRDAGATLVYAVTETSRLLRFDPETASFTPIGTLACGDPEGTFSMAVDRTGIAFVLYAQYQGTSPGHVYRVSLASSACLPTGFVAPLDFLSFGMGFSADDQGTGESLYVASDNDTGGELAVLDTTTYALSPVGFFDPPLTGAELSGTGDGRLFAFYTEGGPSSGGAVAIAQVDKATAKVLARDPLPGVVQGSAWAFAFWGGDFYLFTAPDAAGSIVQRFDPSTGSITQVADYPERIVGAGVSTCAPER